MIFGSALPLLVSLCPRFRQTIWEVSLLTLASVEALRIPLFIATEHPTCRALVSVPPVAYTLVIKQQVRVVAEVEQLFSYLIQQLDSDFFSLRVQGGERVAHGQVIGCYGTC